MTFCQELFKVVIDKLVLGGILFGLGYWAQKKIEKYRSAQALSVEIAKRKVEAFRAFFAARLRVEDARAHFEEPDGQGQMYTYERASPCSAALRELCETVIKDIALYGEPWSSNAKRFADRYSDLFERYVCALNNQGGKVPSNEEWRSLREMEHQIVSQAPLFEALLEPAPVGKALPDKKDDSKPQSLFLNAR